MQSVSLDGPPKYSQCVETMSKCKFQLYFSHLLSLAHLLKLWSKVSPMQIIVV